MSSFESFFPSPAPHLPPFRSIFIKGKYHASAPIHFCLSHVASRPNGSVLFLTPSRESFSTALEIYNDAWLTTSSGSGSSSSASSRIHIYYPPSPAHMALLCSAFQISDIHDNSSFHPKTTLELPPSLIVLHEPSAYFLSNTGYHSHTVSSYMILIAQALAALSFLSKSTDQSGNIAFAVFDSEVDRLKLPVIQPPPGNEDENAFRAESVVHLAQKYFEWIGTFTDASGDNHPDLPDHHQERRKQLRLQRIHRIATDEDILWEWTELTSADQDHRGIHTRSFVWS